MRLFKSLTMTLAISSLVSCVSGEANKLTNEISFPSKTPMLWEVTKDGQTDYIFGTIHVGVDPKELDKAVWQRFKKSDTFVSEISLEEMTSPELAKYLFSPTGKNVGSELSEKEFQSLKEILRGQIPDSSLKLMSAYGANSLAAISLVPQTASIDLTMMQLAKKNSKKSIALETGAAQMEVIQEVMTFETLKKILNEKDKYREYMSELVTSYKEGDLQSLKRLMLDPEMAGMSNEQLDLLIYNRNRNWVNQIPAMLNSGVVFLAGGAGHMVGDQGVIELLKKQGYEVKRITKESH